MGAKKLISTKIISVFCIIFVMFFYSCSEKFIYNRDNIEILQNEYDCCKNTPSRLLYLNLYVKVDKEEIQRVDVLYLQNIYDEFYVEIFDKYSDFLKPVLDQNLVLNNLDKMYGFRFAIDENISSFYKKEGIDGLKIRYLDGDVFRSENLTHIEAESVLYYFFINNYQIYEDDYLGVTLCKKDNGNE